MQSFSQDSAARCSASRERESVERTCRPCGRSVFPVYAVGESKRSPREPRFLKASTVFVTFGPPSWSSEGREVLRNPRG